MTRDTECLSTPAYPGMPVHGCLSGEEVRLSNDASNSKTSSSTLLPAADCYCAPLLLLRCLLADMAKASSGIELLISEYGYPHPLPIPSLISDDQETLIRTLLCHERPMIPRRLYGLEGRTVLRDFDP